MVDAHRMHERYSLGVRPMRPGWTKCGPPLRPLPPDTGTARLVVLALTTGCATMNLVETIEALLKQVKELLDASTRAPGPGNPFLLATLH